MTEQQDIVVHSEDREILRDLYSKTEPVDVYLFHEKYLLSIGQVARVLRKYVEAKVIEINGDFIYLTEYGRRWVVKHRIKLFGYQGIRPWTILPDRLKRTETSANESFIPDSSVVSKVFKRFSR